MDHSDIIISVIVVLCIAAGVTAYGLTNPNNVFSDLAGFTPSDTSDTSNDGGVRLPDSQDSGSDTSTESDKTAQSNDKSSTNSGSHQSNNNKNTNSKNTAPSGTSHSTNTKQNSGSSNSGSGGSSSNSGSSSNTGGSTTGGSSSNSGSNTPSSHPNVNPAGANISNITQQQAINIGNKHVEEPGAYASKAVWDNNTWYVYIHDSKGDTVDVILLDWNGTVIGRG